MKTFVNQIAVAIVLFSVAAIPSAVIGEEVKTGVVLLHGNGHPMKHIEGLVRKLEFREFLVAHPEMPWSSNRRYDASVAEAVNQVNLAIDKLRKQGAQKLYVAGHSKGGVFALYYASNYPVDGLIAIAPGGNVAGKNYKKKLGKSVNKAKKMIGKGKGDEIATFQDLEGARGITDVQAPASAYFTWFDPDGAMNSKRSAKRINANVPILWIVAKDDYKGLRKVNIPMFDRFPSNAETRFYEPPTDHKNAPVDSANEIIKWISNVK